MGIFGEIFGGSEKQAEFKVDTPENAAEQSIIPENKQEILPDAAKFTMETGKSVASVEQVEEIPSAQEQLRELVNQIERHHEELPKQN